MSNKPTTSRLEVEALIIAGYFTYPPLDPAHVRWVANRLSHVDAAVRADERQRIERELLGDTDGGWVPDDSELPVGELRRLLAAGLKVAE